LKKDVDDLGKEEEDEDSNISGMGEEEEGLADDHPDYKIDADPVGQPVNEETFDDDEEFVSSKDMFDEM
jgi:hypothetical protein